MRKDFYIFRHGESSYNALGKIQGRTNDSVLTEKGMAQAQKAGQYLADKKIEAIFCSPLKRALQTAEIVNKFLNVSVFADGHFIEVNVGVIEGLHHTEATAKYGEDYAKWRNRDGKYPDFCFEGGETKLQVRERVFAGLQNLVENSEYQVMAIASHGIMLGQVMLAIGAPDKEVDNGSILHLINEDGNWIFGGLFSVNEKEGK